MPAPDRKRKKELRARVAPRKPPVPFSRVRGPRYRVAHACFACRRSFKIAVDLNSKQPVGACCSDCGQPLKEMGRSFRAPPQSDVEQWMKVEALWEAGFRFWSFRSYPKAEPLPDRLADVADFIRRNPRHPFRLAPAGEPAGAEPSSAGG